MSTDSTTDGEEYSAVDTDWLAHSAYGWGVGFTREQALSAMAAEIKGLDDGKTIEVHLVEHVGDIRTGLFGWRVDNFVSGEVYELDDETFNGLRDSAIGAHVDAELALDREPDETIREEELEEV